MAPLPTPPPLALAGLAIVFAVLALISTLIAVLSRLDHRWREVEIVRRDRAAEAPATIDDVTVVLITAAVAVLLAGRGRVRRVRCIGPRNLRPPTWAQEGRLLLHASHQPPLRDWRSS